MPDVDNKVGVKGHGSVVLYRRPKFGSKTERSIVALIRQTGEFT